MGGYGVAVVSTAVGLGIGILLATCVFFCIRVRRKLSQHLPRQPNQSNRPTDSSSGSFSDSSTVGSVIKEMPRHLEHRSWFTRGHHRADNKSKQGIRIFPYKDVQKATANFSTILGQGSFGPVYKATMPDGEVVAVKVLASDSSQGEREFQTEVDLLSRLHHRNLVNLVGYCVDKGQRMLIYEFMSNGSLESHLYGNDLEDPKILSWEQRLQIILDVCHGIDYLHEGAVPPVMHRDLKPANILLDECMRAKVADFGMSKEVVRLHDGQRKSGLKGTYGYMDPHYIASNRFTTKSDVYSFGLIIFELICAINPQQGLENYINLCSMSEDGNAEWEEILDKKLDGNCDPVELGILGDAALKCLHKNPKMRPSVGDIILTVSKIKQRQLAKEGIPNILRRIETQQKEIRSKTMKKDNKGYN